MKKLFIMCLLVVTSSEADTTFITQPKWQPNNVQFKYTSKSKSKMQAFQEFTDACMQFYSRFNSPFNEQFYTEMIDTCTNPQGNIL